MGIIQSVEMVQAGMLVLIGLPNDSGSGWRLTACLLFLLICWASEIKTINYLLRPVITC